MTNNSAVSSLGLSTHVFAYEVILKYGSQKLWLIDADSLNSPKFLTAKVFFCMVAISYDNEHALKTKKNYYLLWRYLKVRYSSDVTLHLLTSNLFKLV